MIFCCFCNSHKFWAWPLRYWQQPIRSLNQVSIEQQRTNHLGQMHSSYIISILRLPGHTGTGTGYIYRSVLMEQLKSSKATELKKANEQYTQLILLQQNQCRTNNNMCNRFTTMAEDKTTPGEQDKKACWSIKVKHNNDER